MRILAPTIAFALALGALPADAAPNMQAGLWEITVKVDMPGMPAMPATTMRQCVRASDIEDGRRTVPSGGDPKCETKEYRMQGNTANWRMECKGPEAMSGSGTITYGGSSYSGTSKMTLKHDGRAMTMSQSFSGKRIGDCK